MFNKVNTYLYKFCIQGNVPALKNGKVIVTKPFPHLVANSRVQEYMNNFVVQMKDDGLYGELLDMPLSITMKFFRETRHKYDLDNAASTVQDSLMKAKFLEDDSQIKALHCYDGGYDKDNPRVEIGVDIYEIQN